MTYDENQDPPQRDFLDPEAPSGRLVDLARLQQHELAQLLSVTRQTLHAWAYSDDAPLPRNSDGSYSAQQCVAWLVRRHSRGEHGYASERERLAAAQAEKVERENALRAGELLEASAVAETFGQHIFEARARLLRLSSEIGTQMPPEMRTAAERIARDAVYEALRDLALENGRERNGETDGPGPAAGLPAIAREGLDVEPGNSRPSSRGKKSSRSANDSAVGAVEPGARVRAGKRARADREDSAAAKVNDHGPEGA